MPLATRTCLFCAGVGVVATNRAQVLNKIHCVVAEGQSEARNVYDVPGSREDDTDWVVSVPPFATHVQLHAAVRSKLGDMTLTLKDGQDKDRAQFDGLGLPPMGIPLGGAQQVVVACSDPPVDFRVVFVLVL